MFKHEFEMIAGYSVSADDYYDVIEPMYNATNLDKSDFIKCLDRKRFEVKIEKTEAQKDLENRIKEEIENLKETIKWYRDQVAQKEYLLENETDEKWIKIWKEDLKTYKQEIKMCKSKIVTFKFMLE